MRRRTLAGLLAGAILVVAGLPAAATGLPLEPAREVVRLWPGAAPQAQGAAETDVPRLKVHLAPPERANGGAVIVCPGGGYWIRAMDHEGLQVAQWLNAQGLHAFVLSYRTRSTGYPPEVALMDATRAVRLVRAQAADFGIDPRRLGMIGFSAGMHLISAVAAAADAGEPASADPIERVSSRPDFLLMIYGTAAGQERAPEGAQRPLRPDTPPSFVVLTLTDNVPPHSGIRHVLAARDAGLEAELHLFGGDGAHGRGLHTGDPDTGVWPQLAMNWLRRNNFLTAQPRVAVEGRVTIDGVPPFMGWVTLRPVDDANAPTASVHFIDTDRERPRNGRFQIDQKFGPVPGRYRVEVRHQATSHETVPTLPSERRYDRLQPQDADPLEVVIPAEGPFNLELPIRTR